MDRHRDRFHCYNCNNELSVGMHDLDKGQFIRCDRCGESFNLYGIYWSFYEDISLCKRIVDTITDNIGNKYDIEFKDKADFSKIDEALNSNSFSVLLKQIIFDTVLFGNSFVEYKGRGSNILLIRIDPKTVEVKTGLNQEEGFKALSEVIERLIQHIPKEREIDGTTLLHFKSSEGISEPLGSSVCGFWFDSWEIVKNAPEALINMKFQEIQRTDIEGIKKFKDLEESNIIRAAGVPYFMINPSTKLEPSLVTIEMRRFRSHLQRRKDEISRIIVRALFSLILERPYEYETFPEFVFLEAS